MLAIWLCHLHYRMHEFADSNEGFRQYSAAAWVARLPLLLYLLGGFSLRCSPFLERMVARLQQLLYFLGAFLVPCSSFLERLVLAALKASSFYRNTPCVAGHGFIFVMYCNINGARFQTRHASPSCIVTVVFLGFRQYSHPFYRLTPCVAGYDFLSDRTIAFPDFRQYSAVTQVFVNILLPHGWRVYHYCSIFLVVFRYLVTPFLKGFGQYSAATRVARLPLLLYFLGASSLPCSPFLESLLTASPFTDLHLAFIFVMYCNLYVARFQNPSPFSFTHRNSCLYRFLSIFCCQTGGRRVALLPLSVLFSWWFFAVISQDLLGLILYCAVTTENSYMEGKVRKVGGKLFILSNVGVSEQDGRIQGEALEGWYRQISWKEKFGFSFGFEAFDVQ
ncbi:hypothetical protein VNO80_30081 [Phaseolus coccineus]|uniref:Uncharacterized protein n=1 Tax=Phaseolus coccineus TaxID=3886 RepID=A0AAN9LCJ4_PHACN